MNIDEIRRSSYRNFHTRGLDYVCLSRGDSLTVKAYFIHGDVTDAPELVVPHNHRYDFTTQVLDGQVSNQTFDMTNGDGVQLFDYRTPLNGGDGFTWVDECGLEVADDICYHKGETYHQRAHEIHTLKLHSKDTVLILYQFEDVLDLSEPSQSFRIGDGKELPNMDGLYDEFSNDQIMQRLARLRHLGFETRLLDGYA